MTALIKYEEARRALQTCTRIDDAKEIRDKAAALAAYARQRNDVGLERWVAEIKIRAIMRIGELSRELESNQGARTDLTSLKTERSCGKVSILKDAGISTGEAFRAEQLAENAEAVEAYIAEKFEQKRPIKYTEVLAAVQKAERAAKREEKIAEEIRVSPLRPYIERADAIGWLSRQDQCDLLLTDPPYSTDAEDIHGFARSWLPLALSKLKPSGRAYVFIGAYPQELAAYLSVAMPVQILVWTYRNTMGPAPSHRYKQNWQAILFYANADAPPLNCPLLTELFSVQDINAPDGRQGDRYHAWQKPLEIAERFIRHSTIPGSIVFDPFACTGTFLIAAARLGRIARGCDNNEEHISIAVDRGCEA